MKQKTACLGLFSAVAIILGYVESLVPVFAGIPGIKLGLANLGVLFILKKYSFREAALISVVRILVIGFMFGNLFSILYSLAMINWPILWETPPATLTPIRLKEVFFSISVITVILSAAPARLYRILNRFPNINLITKMQVCLYMHLHFWWQVLLPG